MGFMEWIDDEEKAFRAVAEFGARHGYGNLIAHLMREWQIHLMNNGLDEETARNHVSGRTPYGLTYHRPLGLPMLKKNVKR